MKLRRMFTSTILLAVTTISACGGSGSRGDFSVVSASVEELLRVDYKGFTLWLDCDRRSAVRFEYKALKDSGNHKRHSRFYHDPQVPEHCQQTSTTSYKTNTIRRYDRGHLFPANHGDSDKTTIKQSNFMTNILPQAASMNRGAWLHTEEIIECYRNLEPLHVMGGAFAYFAQSEHPFRANVNTL